MKINLSVVRQDLSLLVDSIRELKRRRNESKQPHWTYADIRELDMLKDNATLICSLIAHSRDRLHIKGTTVEKQAKYIIPAFQRYGLPETQAA